MKCARAGVPDAVLTEATCAPASVTQLCQWLGCLPSLSVEAATVALTAIQPVLRTNGHLFDNLLLILRKSIFSHDDSARKVAVVGLLKLMIQFPLQYSISMSASQQWAAMASQSTRSSQGNAPGGVGIDADLLNSNILSACRIAGAAVSAHRVH